MRPRPDRPADDGSAPAEFVMTTLILLALTFGVLQVGAVMLVRNTALDAAAEGARWGAVAGNTAADGVQRTRQVLTVSLGAAYAADVSAAEQQWQGRPAVQVTVRTPLPVLGLWGPVAAIEVNGHAPVETAP